MFEIIKFLFSNFWYWLGGLIYLLVFGEAIGYISGGIHKNVPSTKENKGNPNKIIKEYDEK